MENKEKWQSFGGRLSRLRIKVVLAMLLSAAFVFSVSWVAYHSFKKILDSVDTLSTPRNQTDLIGKIITDIAEIQAYSGQYAISREESALESYREKTLHVPLLIDSLKNSATDTETYTRKLDTLGIVFQSYVGALDEWLALRASFLDRGESRLYGLIDSGNTSLKKKSSEFIPKAQITRITQTVEKPVAVAAVTTPDKPANNKRRRKNQKQDAGKTTDSLNREITTMTITEVDSSYLHKMDTLLDKMKSTLSKSQRNKSGFQKKLDLHENELIQIELVFMDRIKSLLSDIQKEDYIITENGISDAKNTAAIGFRRLIIIGLLSVFVLLLLVFTVFSDISKSIFYRKKLQESKLESERLALAKEEFLANMSHEIRSPLNSIIGLAEQLQHTDLNTGQKSKLHAMMRSSDHLLALVNDILDYSKIEAGSLRLERIGFCYTDVIEEVVEIAENDAAKKDIQIHFDPNEASDTHIMGDPVRLKQILLNLVGNAVKFTSEGSIHITCGKRLHKGKLWITCHIKDTGTGLNPEQLRKIFGKFEQADTSITRQYGGTGLGLSISKKLAELQNGKIWAESEPGKGSTFSFEIPYEAATENEYRSYVEIPDHSSQKLAGKHILMVDDDEMSTEILGPFFNAEKMRYTILDHPEKAMKKITEEEYDIIMVDLHMPGMNGLELLAEIKNLPASKNKKTKTVLCTANVVQNIPDGATDAILYKPYKRKDIMEVLTRIADGGRMAKQPVFSAEESRKFTLKNFETFAGNDSKMLEHFIRLFITNSKTALQKMEVYLKEENYHEIGETAHMLKNTYGQLEASGPLAVIKKLEDLVKGNSLPEAEVNELIDDLNASSKILFEELDREIKNRTVV